jgi:hypothetical protein
MFAHPQEHLITRLSKVLRQVSTNKTIRSQYQCAH